MDNGTYLVSHDGWQKPLRATVYTVDRTKYLEVLGMKPIPLKMAEKLGFVIEKENSHG